MELCFEKTLDIPFLAYYGCSKLLKARAVFYWGTHTRFTVSVGIDLSLTKTRRTRSAGCICMDKRARISPLWEIVYYLDTCIVYLAVRETEYFTEILRNIPRMREQWCPGRFFPSPAKNGLGTRLMRVIRDELIDDMRVLGRPRSRAPYAYAVPTCNRKF